MSELEKKIHDLQIMVEGLKNRIEDIENRKPVVGPKGAPGDISVALHNVTEAMPGLVKAEMARLKFTTLRGETGLSGRDGDQGPKGESALTPTRELIRQIVDTAVATAMAESQLLDETGEHAGPLLRFAIEQELQKVHK